MKKIGLFCGSDTTNTLEIARSVQKAFGETDVELLSIDEAWKNGFESYENLIIGAATWFDGELPTYWDEFLPMLSTMDLSGKKVAVFGLGDQVKYSDNFVDGIGILAKAFKSVGATIVGATSTEGYSFNQSQGVVDNQFLGLAIDVDNEPEKSSGRVQDWVKQLKKEF